MMQALASVLGMALGAAAAGQSAPVKAVALVVEMSQPAPGSYSTAEGGTHPFQRLDWLPDGARVEPLTTDVLIVFESGVRYRFRRGARFTVSAAGPKAVRGSVEELGRMPALPRLVLAEGSRPGPRPGGLRIRGGITGLHPVEPARALADGTALSFVPVPGAVGYRVVLRDAEGAIVWQKAIVVPETDVPSEVLRPATSYSWTVTTEGLAPELTGGGQFATLSHGEAEERNRLASALGTVASRSSSDHALLAAVDLRLGLLEAARAGLRRAQGQDASARLEYWLQEIDRLEAAARAQ